MPVVSVTPEAHEHAKTQAERAGKTLAAWASEKLLSRGPEITVQEKNVPLAPDGSAYCKCDGEWGPGPWHKPGCWRRT